MLWTLLILLSPLWLSALWRLWGWHRRRAGIAPARPRATTWPDVVLVGGRQPRGQPALVPDDTALGAELVVNGERWVVSDLDRVATSTRAWLVQTSDLHQAKLRDERRRELADALEVELNAVVVDAVAPLYGVPATGDIEAIANHYIRRALGEAVASMRWVNHGVATLDDLPDWSTWPRASVRRAGEVAHVRWSVKEMAQAMAARALAVKG